VKESSWKKDLLVDLEAQKRRLFINNPKRLKSALQ